MNTADKMGHFKLWILLQKYITQVNQQVHVNID